MFDLCHFDLLKRGCATSGGFGARRMFVSNSQLMRLFRPLLTLVPFFASLSVHGLQFRVHACSADTSIGLSEPTFASFAASLNLPAKRALEFSLRSRPERVQHGTGLFTERISRISGASTILTELVAILIFQKIDLPLHLQCNSNSSIPKIRSATSRKHKSMETARHQICIYHEILFGLGQEFNLHLPLQCKCEF